MRLALITLAATGLAASASNAGVRAITEDFTDGMGGAAYNSELTYDFGTDTDFAGFDTHDLYAGELNLWSDLVNVSVNSLGANEYIDAVSVTWTDFCGIGCTEITAYGLMSGSMTIGNADVGSQESFTITSADLGGQWISSFDLSSFEGRIERIDIRVVPAPTSLAMLGLGGLAAARRRR